MQEIKHITPIFWKEDDFRVAAYSPDREGDWNRVLEKAENATLMYSRGYLAYHGNRFEDASVLVYHLGEPVAVLPAHRVGCDVYSHQGLGYAGIVCSRKLSVSKKATVFKLILKYYDTLGLSQLYLKEPPVFYGDLDQEFFQYLLFLCGARQEKIELTFVLIQPVDKRQYSSGRKQNIRQAENAGVIIEETRDLEPFWEKLLKPNLLERHGVKPVHDSRQMGFLAAQHPGKIRQFNAYMKGSLVAGATIYETPTAAHAQYLATNPLGRAVHALDYLVHRLITGAYAHTQYFDFGHVNEEEGRKINGGLMHWKESFGAKPFAQRHFSVAVRGWERLGGSILPLG